MSLKMMRNAMAIWSHVCTGPRVVTSLWKRQENKSSIRWSRSSQFSERFSTMASHSSMIPVFLHLWYTFKLNMTIWDGMILHWTWISGKWRSNLSWLTIFARRSDASDSLMSKRGRRPLGFWRDKDIITLALSLVDPWMGWILCSPKIPLEHEEDKKTWLLMNW